jgi:glycerophosphoryl diester phosphodiesterase
MRNAVLAIAHRGDPITARENTFPAFAAAVERGADMVEIDLRRTRDGEIVVLHDPTLTRMWGLERSVIDLDLSALADLGRRGGRSSMPNTGTRCFD